MQPPRCRNRVAPITTWLNVSPSTTFLAGPTSTNLVVSVNQSGLTIVGTTCTGLITVSATSGTQTVLVTMTIISAPTSVLTVSPSSLTFNAVAGAAAPASQTLAVTAYFDTTATAQVTEQSCANSAWLTLSPNGTFTANATATNFTVSVNPSGIAAGTTCTGAIVINPVTGVRMVPVTLIVAPVISAQLTFSASALTFNAVAGAVAPPSQTLTVTAQSSASVTAQVSEQTCTSSNWLALTPTGSFTAGPSELQLHRFGRSVVVHHRHHLHRHHRYGLVFRYANPVRDYGRIRPFRHLAR